MALLIRGGRIGVETALAVSALLAPVLLAPRTSVVWTSVSAGDDHTCAVTASMTAYCWGQGALGNGRVSTRARPVAVSGGLRFRSVSAGTEHTCGITVDSIAYCWGINEEGQLGAPTRETCRTPMEAMPCSTTPARVAGDHKFISISAGEHHTCGVTSTGDAYCWGNGGHGQLGGTALETCQVTWFGMSHEYPCAHAPSLVSGGWKFTTVATGLMHSCGLTVARTVYCWGTNDRGQLGTDSAAQQCPPWQKTRHPCSTTPVALTLGVRFASLSVGTNHNCGVTAAQAVYCWGWNFTGQLGTGSESEPEDGYPTPAAVRDFTFATVSAGGWHTCAVTGDGLAYCWGANNPMGESGRDAAALGSGGPRERHPAPVPVSGGLRFESLSAGNTHTCGIAGGRLYCWGANLGGQLGAGPRQGTNAPIAVAEPR